MLQPSGSHSRLSTTFWQGTSSVGRGLEALLQPYVTATHISIVSRPGRRRRSSHNDRMVVSTEADEAGIKPQELGELPANDFIGGGQE